LAANFAIGNPVAFDASAGGPRHARVHLDHDHAPVLRVDRELDVRAAALDPDLAHDADRGVPHVLVLAVGQRLGRRDRDRVARVHAHRVEVLDRADDDDVVGVVAHHLHLELLPADQALLDEHLVFIEAASRARRSSSNSSTL
jgi:hypothetical protein